MLWGEDREAGLRIMPPIAYHDPDEKFDLILNVDSLTEMAQNTAREYIVGARYKTNKFLSINHENNQFTVADIYRAEEGIRVSRTPCWARRGYVEELIEFVRNTKGL